MKQPGTGSAGNVNLIRGGEAGLAPSGTDAAVHGLELVPTQLKGEQPQATQKLPKVDDTFSRLTGFTPRAIRQALDGDLFIPGVTVIAPMAERSSKGRETIAHVAYSAIKATIQEK